MTKRILICIALGLSVAGRLMGAAEPPATLTLADLIDRPERWPATVTATANVRTKTGQTVLQGQKLPVLSVNDKGVFGRNAAGAQVGLFTAQCDLLEQANARWAQLTPGQRTLDDATILNDSSLWPEMVTLRYPTRISTQGGGSRVLPAGHPCQFFYFHDGNVGVVPRGVAERKWFKPDSVDLITGGRERFQVDAASDPPRWPETLRPAMTVQSGPPVVPASLDRTRAFVFFWGANWCGWCHKVSPELADFIRKHEDKLGDVTVVMMDGDKQDSEMLKYMQEKKLPWPAVRMSDWNRVPFFNFTHEGSYPQLLITDRYGKILYNGGGGGPKDIKDHLDAMTQVAAGTLTWTAPD